MSKILWFLLFIIVVLAVLTVRLRDMGGVVYNGATAENKQIYVSGHTNGKILKISVDDILVFNGIIKKPSRSDLLTEVPVPKISGAESRVRIYGDLAEADTLINWIEYNSVIIYIVKSGLSVSFANDPKFL
ncbi:MAG: hypothetical protein GTO42_01125 [Candidatus Latescibacteria bacterium]|nr:hypothetical protein [Candidatus Latescibacterota bacterium]NIO27131.1 hypothetical protein [Candidatus Latescibacterota bacterium]NIO54655.1 hypothetical protein [Candidatus Latescibacterota bacterium]NIT00738.1 hypothetical protein [Candidatus Latescibacterota bacterium]NIT37661.1 hypothetical protein [Candidatus Latescibacterota bacterium]